MTDEPAFDFLAYVCGQSTSLRRRISAIVGDKGGEPDDVMQDVLCRLWERRACFASQEDADRFCMVQAGRIAADNARRHRRAAAATLKTRVETAPDPAAEVEERALLAAVRQVLTERQAAVWIGTVVEGRSHRDMARTFNTSENAVAVSLRKAWNQLQRKRHLFRSFVTGVAITPRRRPWGCRPSAAWCGAMATAVAGVSLVMVRPSEGGADGAARPPTPAIRADRQDYRFLPVPAEPRWTPDVRAADGPAGARASAGHEPAAGPTNKVTGCLAGGVVCTGARGDGAVRREGHGVWIGRTPVSQSTEVWQTVAPVCGTSFVMPKNGFAGCVRHSETHLERGRHFTAAVPDDRGGST